VSALGGPATAVIAVVMGSAPPPEEEISESAQSLWEKTTDAAPRLGVAIAIVFAGWLAARGLRWLLHRRFSKTQTTSFANVMSKIASWIFVFIVILIAIAITFPSVKPVDLLAGLGFFSVAVGFAFQDILENTLSGILLLFRQPFRSGDQITVMDRSGTVQGITIRETKITTYDGELVVIPNRDVYKNVINVHTHNEDHRLEFVVGIAYENDPTEAIEVIHDALARVDHVRAEPEPLAIVSELGVSTVDITVYFWTDAHRLQSLTTRDAAIREVKRALDEAGIEMPAEIIALQATPSFRAALSGEQEVTPGGGVRAAAARSEHSDARRSSDVGSTDP
jgi:small-conductance mechanosensitive channel